MNFLILGMMLGVGVPFPLLAESNCGDGIDNDGDSVEDCADAECKDSSYCASLAGSEASDVACSDWVDNDGDGLLDCDDSECHAPSVAICRGSWDVRRSREGERQGGEAPLKIALVSNLSREVESKTGRGASADDRRNHGENNEFTCSDGIDNDGDGKVDCQDSDCLEDQTITACRSGLSMRFLLGAHVAPFVMTVEAKENSGEDPQTTFDAELTKLQFRALGEIPFIDKSFFLVSARLEETPRITFALFQVPTWKNGYFNINTGGATLSNVLVLSSSKQLLLDSSYALYLPFERRLSLGVELGTKLDEDNKWSLRLFGGGGNGLRWGDKFRYNFAAGATLQWNAVGYYNRWDTPFLYRPAPKTLALLLGGKFSHREYEKFITVAPQLVLNWGRFNVLGEAYIKREFDFEQWSVMWHVQTAFLLWPKHLLLAADIGELWLGKPNLPWTKEAKKSFSNGESRNVLTWRVALHWFFWRNIGIASLLYSEMSSYKSQAISETDRIQNSELRFEIQFRI